AGIGPKTVTACDRIRLRAETKTGTTCFRSSGAGCPRIAGPKTVTSCDTIRSAAIELVASLPWGHNIALMQKVKEVDARLWYARAAVEYGWSRAVLTHQIETQLHRREGKAITNFAAALPAPQSDLAHQTLKDPYIFDFLTMDAGARERDLELGLLNHVQKFLVELGVGFAFVGRQYPWKCPAKNFFSTSFFIICGCAASWWWI